MNNDETTKRIAKPIGVYIITALDFLILGLMPLAATVWLGRNADAEVPFVGLVLAIILAILVMAGAVWAWIGDNLGRRFLLGGVTATCLLLIVNGLTFALGQDVEGREKLSFVNLIVRGVFWLGVNWWYFTRPTVAGYYRQNTWN